MISLTSKAGTATPTADYPYGDILNNTTPGSGTPVNVQVYGDFHQFFSRLMAMAGITPNNLRDNVTNGFQLYDALLKVTQPDWSNSGIVFATIRTYTWGNDASEVYYDVACKTSRTSVELRGSAKITSLSDPGDIPVCTLPAGSRPTKKVYPLAIVTRGTTRTVEPLTIGTDGVVVLSMLAGTFTPVQVWFDGISFGK